VDDAVRVLLVVPPPPEPDAHPKAPARAPVVVAATDAGAVHFLQLCAPPPAR
jgi:hypothetical protein